MRLTCQVTRIIIVILQSIQLPSAFGAIPSVARLVNNQQVTVTLNYSTWSGYFYNQIQFVKGKMSEAPQSQHIAGPACSSFAQCAGDLLFDASNTSWSVKTNFTIYAAPANSSTTDRRGKIFPSNLRQCDIVTRKLDMLWLSCKLGLNDLPACSASIRHGHQLHLCV